VQGLKAGVTVATSGFDRLENGVKVVARGQRVGSSNSGGKKQGSNNPEGAGK
jgi:hypothetical protein